MWRLSYGREGMKRVVEGDGRTRGAQPKMNRQADGLSEEWVRLYNEHESAETVEKG